MNQLDQLRRSRDASESMAVVHYACENLHEAPDRPAAVACIVVLETDNGAIHLFSRTQAPEGTEDSAAEIDLLRRFFEFARAHSGTQFIHWNMSYAGFGFSALESRYRFLTNENPPGQIPSTARHDLDDLVEATHGPDYVSHPKLASLAQLNGLAQRSYLTGIDEAQRFNDRDFGAIERSTEEKVRWINRLLGLLLDGDLDTHNSTGSVEFAGAAVDAVGLVVALGTRLRYVQRELANRHGSRPTMTFADEYDDQDLFRALLRVFFEDVRNEEFSPSHGGSGSRIDFLLPEVELAVELKHARASMSASDLGQELITDAERYAQHPSARHLVCIVVDHEGLLPNPRGLEHDLSREARQDDLGVTVTILDR